MTGNFGWTPASKVGIIPLRPLMFGEILGKSFSALRHNPRVLFGFAIVVSVVVSLVSTAVIAWMTFNLVDRISTFPPNQRTSPEFYDVLIGSLGLISVVGFLLGIVGFAISIVVQAVVAAEVGGAVVAEKQSLGEIWRRVRRSIMRLVGFSLLVGVSVIGVSVAVVYLTIVFGRAAVILMILAILAAIPLTIWLSTKLALTPSIIVLENERVFAAIRRSWQLTTGFFWRTFGVFILIAIIFGVAGSIVGNVFGFFTQQFVPVLAPTGDLEIDAVGELVMMSLIPTAVTTVISAIGTVVSATGITLVYVDIRMNKEGLGLDLQKYVEDRDAGRPVPENPYLPDPSRVFANRYGANAFGASPYSPTSGYPTASGGVTPPTTAPAPSRGFDLLSTPSGESDGPASAAPTAPGYNAPKPFFPVSDENPEDQQGRS